MTKKDFKQIKKMVGDVVREATKNVATKDDFKRFATKDDLKNFATKDDLKNFATKDDLKKFVTKNDLKKFAIANRKDHKDFATKNEIKKYIDVIAEKFVTNDKLDKTIRDLHNDIAQFKDDILKEIVKLREEVAIVGGFRDRIDNHEVRIDKLEQRPCPQL